MRKLLMGAIAASATLALAAGAVAQDEGVTFDATVSPSKAGTKQKPKNTTLGFEMQVDRPGTTVEIIDLELPKGLKLSGQGLGRCTEDGLYPSVTPACKKATAGPPGTADAVLAPNNTPIHFSVTPYVQDKDTLLFYVVSERGIAIQTPLTGEITRGGRRLQITIPPELRCPACPPPPPAGTPKPHPGNDASLTALDATFFRKKGSNYLVSSTGCKSRKHSFNATLTFSERRDGAPVPVPAKGRTTARCSK